MKNFFHASNAAPSAQMQPISQPVSAPIVTPRVDSDRAGHRSRSVLATARSLFCDSNNISEKKDIEEGYHSYTNIFGETAQYKTPDVETYLSRTRFRPRKLVVQASKHNVRRDDTEEWERRPVKGAVPTALKIAEWTLQPGFPKRGGGKRVHWKGLPAVFFRTLLVAFPLQIYMSLPIFTTPWEEDVAEDTYLDWPGYHWKWPKFAVNPLDMAPSSERAPPVVSSIPRLLRPRLLMVRNGDQFVCKDMNADPGVEIPYVMISYANRHFHTHLEKDDPENRCEQLRKIARYQAEKHALNAYWMDFECRASSDDVALLDSDVNRFCDVVRGARKVIIALPDDSLTSAQEWGSRMWTLPEGLLAPGDKLLFHYVQRVGGERDDPEESKIDERTKVEMANLTWRSLNNSNDPEAAQVTRILAEHYSGTTQLSRLQLMAAALTALWNRKAPVTSGSAKNQHRPGELAFALMGLLHSRIDPQDGNTLFQDIAKLSLGNDSDQLVERMVCLLPADDEFADGETAQQAVNPDPFEMLQKPDEFNAHLWHIHPTCEVVGVDEQDRTVILNDCRAIAIRWKAFPKILFKRSSSFKKFCAEIFLRSGTWWFLTGVSLIYTYAPVWDYIRESASENDINTLDSGFVWAAVFFLLMGLTLSVLGPISLRILYGGLVMEPAPHLVAFEGTMPITELETIIFGNYDNRLAYEPSSTKYSKDYRDSKQRKGTEPKWVRESRDPPSLKKDYRIFTLVDTGNLSVSIFQAERPPTVALICGREGGMLRTVLCSWKSDADCLYKETVMRMPTETYETATQKGWLKVQLGRAEPLKHRVRPKSAWRTLSSRFSVNRL